MSKQYINSSNNSPSLSLNTFVVWYLALEKFNAPQWLYGAFGLLALILTITFFVRLFTEDGVDVVKR